MCNSGIYIIRNKVNNKVYVGQSGDLKTRERHHFYYLKNGNHKNIILQRAFNKHGEDSFKFDVVEYIHSSDLNDREKHWANYYNAYDRDFGYNIAECGGNDTSKLHGKTDEEIIEIKNKMSIAKKNKLYPSNFTDYMRESYNDSFEIRDINIYLNREFLLKIINLESEGEIYCAFSMYIHSLLLGNNFIFTIEMFMNILELGKTSFIGYINKLEGKNIISVSREKYKPNLYSVNVSQGDYNYMDACECSMKVLFSKIYTEIFNKKELKNILGRYKYKNMILGYEPIMVKEVKEMTIK